MGNSTGLMVSGLEPGAATYAVHLERLLHEDGRDALVWNQSRWFGLLDEAVTEWEQTILAVWPDLVVLQFGVNECRGRLIPRSVTRQRWMMWRRETLRNRIWHRGLETLWEPVFALYRAVEAVFVPTRFSPGYTSPARFRRLLHQMLRLIEVQTNARIAVIDVHPTTRILEVMSPHYEVRRQRLQAVLEEVVDSHHRAFRVETAPLMAKAGGDREALPDGFHYSPVMHRLVAEEIACRYRTLCEGA